MYQLQFVLCIVMCKVGTWTIYTALYFTLSVRCGLAPALSRDWVVVTSPLSAEKNRADQLVVCEDRE